MKNIKERLISIWAVLNVRIFIFYVIASFAVNIDKFILGSNALFKGHDTLEAFWVYQVALAERIFSFQMPGWWPDIWGGLPFFYMDINWLSLSMLLGGLFSDQLAFTAVLMMQFVIACYGGYLFLVHFFSSDKRLSFAVGLLWGLSTFNLTYWRVCDLASIPLLLYCTEKIALPSNKKTRLLVFVGLLICSLNISFAKGAPFIASFHLFFIFISNKDWNKRIKVLIPYVFVWTFVVIINMPLIISLLSSVDVGSRKLIQWVPQASPGLIEYFISMFRSFLGQSTMGIGTIGALVLIYGFFRFKKWNKLTKALFCFFIGVCVYVHFIDRSVWFMSLRAHLPLTEFRLSRFALVVPFIFFVIVADNLESFIAFIQKSFKNIVLFTTTILTVIVIFHLTKHGFPSNYIETLSSVFSVAIFLIAVYLLRKIKNRQTIFINLFIVLFFVERIFNSNLNRPADIHPPSFTHYFKSELFDKFRPEMKYDYRIGFVNWHPTSGIFNGIQVAGGYGPQYLKRYADFWESVLFGENERSVFKAYPLRAYLMDKNVERETLPPQVIKNLTFNTDLLALHNVRYIFSLNEIIQPNRWGLSLVHKGEAPSRAPGLRRGLQMLKRVSEQIQYFVYEIDEYAPRLFIANKFNVVGNEKELKTYLQKSSIKTLKNKVVYNSQDLTSLQISLLESIKKEDTLRGDTRGFERVVLPKIDYYSDNKIVIDVTSDTQQLLVLNENYINEWTAEINGNVTQILPAYGVFRSVIINEGHNKITFEYKPQYLIKSFWVAGLGGSVFVFFGLFWSLRANKQDE